eukprot:COSAG01_NODE_25470_length_744_cov_1.051163_1_plen_48_part_10
MQGLIFTSLAISTRTNDSIPYALTSSWNTVSGQDEGSGVAHGGEVQDG